MVDNVNPSVTVSGQPVDASLISYTHIIYALHSLSVLIGLTSAVTIVGSFVFGLPSIIAVIMNYARQSDVRGTFLESHFRWQIRTFWFALLWVIVILAVSLPLMLIVVGFFTLWVGFVLLGIWVIYRIIRGWLALRDQRPVNP
ncbi:MAG: hypothetical protein JWO04_5517 [Gammaproteobacteria bacterium]|jgi:uncharacterized membrane protein|nr:hypothetical protein [Gammaproteobacteria bacterium]